MFIVNSNMGTSKQLSDARADNGSKADAGSSRMMDSMMNQVRGLDQASQNLSVLIRQHCQPLPVIGF